MSDKNDGFLTGLAGSFVIGLIIGFLVGGYAYLTHWQNLAIAHNAAHWEVSTFGTPSFVWNQPAESTP